METASVRVEAPSFPNMEATWNFTVCSEIDKRPAISLLPSPAEIIWSTSRSRGKRLGEPIRSWLLRQHDNCIFPGNLCVLKRVQQLFVSVCSDFDQNNIRLNVDKLPGDGFKIRTASSNVDVAIRQHTLQARANQRRNCDDKNANHAATESFPTGIPSLTVTRRTRE